MKKKNSRPIIITLSVLMLLSCCCCGDVEMSSSKNDEIQSSSESSLEISVAETTESTIEETTTVESTSENTSEDNPNVSSEAFIDIIKETIQGTVGTDEYITDVALTDNILTIYVDLSKADTTIVPFEDLAISRASSITDSFLELKQYDDLWEEIIIDFGNVGQVKNTKSDIIESSYGRYFNITEIETQ